MGSSGSGSFSDYSKRMPQDKEEGTGGSSGQDKCGQAFDSSLEEVSRCFYFMNNSSLPSVGTEVAVVFNGLRLAVETISGEELGYLPTSRNYLKACMDNGFAYVGAVSSSSLRPSPSIRVDIFPA